MSKAPIYKWYVLPINPEPWATGEVVVGRRNGRLFGTLGPNSQLQAYQASIKEEIGHLERLYTGNVDLVFYFWRNRADYTSPNQRKIRKHEADVTNLQKALEDALQGILIKNDRDVRHIESYMVAQGPDVKGCIVIGIREIGVNSVFSDFPFEVRKKIIDFQNSNPQPKEKKRPRADDIF